MKTLDDKSKRSIKKCLYTIGISIGVVILANFIESEILIYIAFLVIGGTLPVLFISMLK